MLWLWLWLWWRPAATAPIRPLDRELPHAVGAALKKERKKKKKKKKTHKKQIREIFYILAVEKHTRKSIQEKKWTNLITLKF